MKNLEPVCKIAVVQAEPILFDKNACVKKAVAMIGKAADHRAELIVFPELFIPGYPSGMTFGLRLAALRMPDEKIGSCIIDPYGHYETQPVWDKEQSIYADLTMDKVSMSRMEFDVCSHYARPDVLRFHVKEEEQ